MDDVTHDFLEPEAWLVSHDELVHGVAIRDALRRHRSSVRFVCWDAAPFSQCMLAIRVLPKGNNGKLGTGKEQLMR